MAASMKGERTKAHPNLLFRYLPIMAWLPAYRARLAAD